MGPGMFHVGTREKVFWWCILVIVVLFLLGTGFILGRASVTWPTPHIEWRSP